MSKYQVTLKDIKSYYPSKSSWKKLLKSQNKKRADNELFDIADILESNGVNDFVSFLPALDEKHNNDVRLLLCDIAERALRFVPKNETRPVEAIRVARLYVQGKVNTDELRAASEAARNVATHAAWAAAWAASDAVTHAAWGVINDAAWAADSEALERDAQKQIIKTWLKS